MEFIDWYKKHQVDIIQGNLGKQQMCRMAFEAGKQSLETRPHEPIVIFDTREKVAEGSLLLSRIRQIDHNQSASDKVKRMNELIKATGFELHYRK